MTTWPRPATAQSVAVEPGDMVCLHTGFADALLAMGGEPDLERLAATGAVLDGSDQRLQRWVDESGLVALIADNYAVEHAAGRPRARDGTRSCRCTSCACSSSASIWASSGTCTTSRAGSAQPGAAGSC